MLFLKPFGEKGNATELVDAGLRYIFTETSLEEIYALTEPENTASQKVLSKSGFVRTHDHIEKQKSLAQYLFTRNAFLKK
jgi:ribosomal-protein-alanine N-acetyltransferase